MEMVGGKTKGPGMLEQFAGAEIILSHIRVCPAAWSKPTRVHAVSRRATELLNSFENPE